MDGAVDEKDDLGRAVWSENKGDLTIAEVFIMKLIPEVYAAYRKKNDNLNSVGDRLMLAECFERLKIDQVVIVLCRLSSYS